ncbi:hypothetical protein KGA66_14595 [Actinocrinis puniceicyclus]|uniref:Cupin domain-containing protein n=1 Tax=Actinocrinis puniceicyclus TaxID=977794 RepID=A0A8J7WL24_9ACTN|nr:hypothetical protein [Actinocrinis puniceicyclus]MBS2964286.1 hypothetical protein [Actinocrinis puniceicyclus]
MTLRGRVRRWTVRLAPGAAVDFVAADWADALVVVKRGELEVECRSGRRARFAAGAVLTFAGLPVRRLHNPHPEPVVLSLVARRSPDR